jgi:hypothetical protein
MPHSLLPWIRLSGTGGVGGECPVWCGDLPFNNLLETGKDGVLNGDNRPLPVIPRQNANGENAA